MDKNTETFFLNTFLVFFKKKKNGQTINHIQNIRFCLHNICTEPFKGHGGGKNLGWEHKIFFKCFAFSHKSPVQSCFCAISTTKNIPNISTALFCVSEQHNSVSFLNESTV